MAIDPALANFLGLKSQYFDVVCHRLGLVSAKQQLGAGFAIASAVGGAVRVCFEHDRGLCLFSIGPAVDSEPMCSVETIAARFPRVRHFPGGEQRLSLVEQAELIARHWSELQEMFSPAKLPATREWLAGVRAAVTARYSRVS